MEEEDVNQASALLPPEWDARKKDKKNWKRGCKKRSDKKGEGGGW